MAVPFHRFLPWVFYVVRQAYTTLDRPKRRVCFSKAPILNGLVCVANFGKSLGGLWLIYVNTVDMIYLQVGLCLMMLLHRYSPLNGRVIPRWGCFLWGIYMFGNPILGLFFFPIFWGMAILFNAVSFGLWCTTVAMLGLFYLEDSFYQLSFGLHLLVIFLLGCILFPKIISHLESGDDSLLSVFERRNLIS